MKKLFFLTTLIFLMSQVVCSAELSRDQIAVGGIYPGRTTANEVEQMYGAFTARNGNLRYYADDPYADPSVSIQLMENRVIHVATTLRDWETPDGVHRGMNESVLNDVYGSADNVVKKDGVLRYCYYSGSYVLEFWVKSTGEIYLIVAKMRD